MTAASKTKDNTWRWGIPLLIVFVFALVLVARDNNGRHAQEREERIDYCADLADGAAWRIHREGAYGGHSIWWCTINPAEGFPVQFRLPE